VTTTCAPRWQKSWRKEMGILLGCTFAVSEQK
jgi:hypothetical protein